MSRTTAKDRQVHGSIAAFALLAAASSITATDRPNVLVGDWKAVAAAGGPWELYDLAADRTRMADRAAVEAAVAVRLTAAVLGWRKSVP